MTEDFDIILSYAIKRCEGILFDDSLKNFHLLYPFTTENIAGYINEFDLAGKKLLTVGSSGDQAINAVLKDCKDITIIDINYYTKFYYYLKVASILSLNKDEFMEFLKFKDYPKVFKDNKKALNKKSYDKVKKALRILDYESYLFWDELLQTFNPIDVRKRLFYFDEDRDYVISDCNLYLQNNYLYEKTKTKIKGITPTFINDDIFKVELNEKYDNIWLSNIGTYLSRNLIKIMIDKFSELLNTNAQLLISYLYKTTKDTEYKEDWSPIYNLEKTFDILKEYEPDLMSFTGIDGIRFKDNDIKDSILVYYKHK